MLSDPQDELKTFPFKGIARRRIVGKTVRTTTMELLLISSLPHPMA